MILNSPASVVLRDPDFLSQLQEAASATDRSMEDAQKYAAKCLHEVEATPKDSWLRPAARMARFIYTRSYEKQLDVNQEAVERLRELYKDHLILFLWSH